MRAGADPLLPPVRARPLAEPGRRRVARARLGVDARPDRPLGARRRHLALYDPARRATRDAYPGRDQGPLRRPPDEGEGRRPARRRVPDRRASRDPRLHLLLAGRRARGGGCSRERLGDRADVPRLAATASELAARLRERRRLRLLLAHRHLRPGDGRGAGQRAARRRGRRGRPGSIADPTSVDAGWLCEPEPGGDGGRGSLQLADAPYLREPSSAAAALAAVRGAAGRPRWASSPPAYDELLAGQAPRSPRSAASRCPALIAALTRARSRVHRAVHGSDARPPTSVAIDDRRSPQGNRAADRA